MAHSLRSGLIRRALRINTPQKYGIFLAYFLKSISVNALHGSSLASRINLNLVYTVSDIIPDLTGQQPPKNRFVLPLPWAVLLLPKQRWLNPDADTSANSGIRCNKPPVLRGPGSRSARPYLPMSVASERRTCQVYPSNYVFLRILIHYVAGMPYRVLCRQRREDWCRDLL